MDKKFKQTNGIFFFIIHILLLFIFIYVSCTPEGIKESNDRLTQKLKDGFLDLGPNEVTQDDLSALCDLFEKHELRCIRWDLSLNFMNVLNVFNVLNLNSQKNELGFL